VEKPTYEESCCATYGVGLRGDSPEYFLRAQVDGQEIKNLKSAKATVDGHLVVDGDVPADLSVVSVWPRGRYLGEERCDYAVKLHGVGLRILETRASTVTKA
jgi:hypothetical protein